MVQVWFAIALSCLGLIAGDIIVARDLMFERFWRQQRNGEIPFARLRLPTFLLVERDRADDDQPLNQLLIPRADVEDDQDVIG